MQSCGPLGLHLLACLSAVLNLCPVSLVALWCTRGAAGKQYLCAQDSVLFHPAALLTTANSRPCGLHRGTRLQLSRPRCLRLPLGKERRAISVGASQLGVFSASILEDGLPASFCHLAFLALSLPVLMAFSRPGQFGEQVPFVGLL